MVIDRQVGRGAVLDEAINDALPQIYIQALQDNDLQPLAQPEIEVTKLEDNEALEFTAEVDVKPEIDAARRTTASTAQVDDVAVTDEDVDEQVEALRERFAHPDRRRARRPPTATSWSSTSSATQDGEAVEGAEVTGMSYKVGRGGMLDGLDEALAGMGAGDEKTFTSQLVGGDLVGQDVEVTVKVGQVQEQELPELDDEFAQLASEFDTVDELTRRRARAPRPRQAPRAGRRRPRRRPRGAARARSRSRCPRPSSPTSSTPVASNDRAAARLRRHDHGEVPRGRGPDRGGVRGRPRAPGPRRRRRPVRSSTRSPPRRSSASTRTSSPQHLVRRAQQSGQDPQEFANHMFEHNHIPELVQEIRRGKALAQIVESATVTDASGNVVELKNLRPDGTIGEPVDETVEEAGDEARRRAGRGARRRATSPRTAARL